jgi:hypothetical protein
MLANWRAETTASARVREVRQGCRSRIPPRKVRSVTSLRLLPHTLVHGCAGIWSRRENEGSVVSTESCPARISLKHRTSRPPRASCGRRRAEDRHTACTSGSAGASLLLPRRQVREARLYRAPRTGSFGARDFAKHRKSENHVSRGGEQCNRAGPLRVTCSWSRRDGEVVRVRRSPLFRCTSAEPSENPDTSQCHDPCGCSSGAGACQALRGFPLSRA